MYYVATVLADTSENPLLVTHKIWLETEKISNVQNAQNAESLAVLAKD